MPRVRRLNGRMLPTAPQPIPFGVGERLNAPGGHEVGTGSLFGKILSVITAPITAPIKAIAKVTAKIPVIGPLTHIVSEAAAAPANVAVSIASGERLDHVAVDALKAQLKIVKDVAPYAQTVVSFVPGIGTGVSAAIGAGAALAEGQSITQAAKAAIRGAIPGGPIAAAGFDLATKVASGENVAKAALETARNQLPQGAQQAFDIGLAVVTGEKIQTALTKGLVTLAPEGLQSVLNAGTAALQSVPGLADAIKSVAPGSATEGFKLAAGLLSHSGINEKSLSTLRSTLPPEVVQGFDAALKTQVPHIAWLTNVVTSPTATDTATALQQLAKLSPADQKKLIELQQLSTLTPTQKTQLIALKASMDAKAAAAAAPKPAPKPPQMTEPIKRTAPQMPAPKAPAKPAAPAAPARGPYAPYPKIGAVAGLGDCGPECHTLGNPITQMPADMRRAGMSAVHGSQGRPRMVHSPDGKNYLFEINHGVLSARECRT